MRRLCALAALLLACDSIQVYRVEGRVVSVDREGQRIEIAHEDIEGFMPAMVMPFDVADPGLLEGVEPGFGVRFELERRGSQLRILQLEVTDRSTAGAGEGSGFVSSPAPPFELVDQDGRPVALADLAGKALLVDFIFTRCPGPCPVQTALHVALQRGLDPEVAARTHFVSITLDPDHDGPEQLRAYADRHGADLSRWSFLSGSREAVGGVARAYHVAPSGLADRGLGPVDHVMARYLIDPSGRIARRWVGSDVTREELERGLVDALG